MSILVVGISHRSAPLAVIEAVAVRPEGLGHLNARLVDADSLAEFMVIATCNRVEVIAEAERFHAAVNDIALALADVSGLTSTELSEHVYVHYDDRAVHHLFSLTCGLESMAWGEPQILGQVRNALSSAQRVGSVGRQLNSLVQQALRVAKRAHTETDLDVVARSLVQLGLDSLRPALPPISSARILVVGAGTMAGLALTTLNDAGAREVTIVNRDAARAAVLAQRHGGRTAEWADLPRLLGEVDLVISCTGAREAIITVDAVRRTRLESPGVGALAFLDLSLPADVDPGVIELCGVTHYGLASIKAGQADAEVPDDSRHVFRQVQDLITGEVAMYIARAHAHAVAPTVAALRARASTVVDAEVERLSHRLPDLDERSQAEIRKTVSRVVDKLLHTPTVRAKELNTSTEPGDYARVLHELFDLDPRDTVAVQSPPPTGSGDLG